MDPILAIRAIKYSYYGIVLNDLDHPFKIAIDLLWIQAVVVTTFGLMSVSVDRYIAITKVFIYESLFTTRRCIYLICFVWFSSFIFALSRLFVPDDKLGRLWVATAVVSCAIPFSVTSYCYLAIFRAARKQLKRIVNETTTKSSRRLEEARHRKTAWTIGIVITLFFFLWFPSLVVSAVNLTLTDTCTKAVFSHQIWIWIEWIAYLSSAINPWVYSMRSAEFRTACKMRLGLQKSRVIPEEMISRSKARPSVIPGVDNFDIASTNVSNGVNTDAKTVDGYSKTKTPYDFKNTNHLLPPVI